MNRNATGKRPSIGQEIITDLTDLAEALERDELPEARFIARSVELPDEPGAYNAAKANVTRDR